MAAARRKGQSMKTYVNLSKQTTFNGKKVEENEVIVPVVFNEEMEITLRPLGLNKANVRKWKFPNTSMKVPVVFMAVDPTQEAACWKYFNNEVSRYLKQYDFDENIISLDKMLDDIVDEDKRGFDPTGSTKYDDLYLYEILLAELLEKIMRIDPKMALCIEMLTQGYKKGEILEALELGVAKTQGYEYIKKAQEIAKKMI